MFQKLFNIAVVVFLVVVSLAVLAFLFRGLLSTFSSPLLTDTNGVTAVAGGVSEKYLRLVFLLSVLIGGGYLYLRGRKSR
ncbi:MAG TPA: hypothetical protein VFY34_08545 [Pyrinomonadaceae bacterium]|nr:hypothetical protein [Pyrinomonadaceae bacterium]